MKALISLVSFLLFPLSVLFAQMGTPLLASVSEAIANKEWDKANELFLQAVKENADKAGDYYWVNVKPDCTTRKSFALDLGIYYKEHRNFEKASPYFLELVQMAPQDVNCLSQCAAVESRRGEFGNALDLYLKVLAMDENNLDANIFVGNYYYFYAEKERKKLQTEYSKLTNPTRMQYARYQDELSRVVSTDYGKAKQYFKRVLGVFPSMEVRKTLNKIEALEKGLNK